MTKLAAGREENSGEFSSGMTKSGPRTVLSAKRSSPWESVGSSLLPQTARRAVFQEHQGTAVRSTMLWYVPRPVTASGEEFNPDSPWKLRQQGIGAMSRVAYPRESTIANLVFCRYNPSIRSHTFLFVVQRREESRQGSCRSQFLTAEVIRVLTGSDLLRCFWSSAPQLWG